MYNYLNNFNFYCLFLVEYLHRDLLNHSPLEPGNWNMLICSSVWRVMFFLTFYMEYNQSTQVNIVIMHINGKQIEFAMQHFDLFVILLQLQYFKSKINFESVSNDFSHLSKFWWQPFFIKILASRFQMLNGQVVSAPIFLSMTPVYTSDDFFYLFIIQIVLSKSWNLISSNLFHLIFYLFVYC